MIFWIKRVATILGFSAFFAVLFICLAGSVDPFDPMQIVSAIIKASLGAALFWFAGFIIADIFFKGVLTDINVEDSNLLEGGLIQHLHTKKEQQVPGGPDMPFANSRTEYEKKASRRRD